MPPDSAEIDTGLDHLVGEVHRHVVRNHLDPGPDRHAILEHLRAIAPLLGAATELKVLARVVDRVAGLGTLANLLDDDRTTDILVNGPGRVWIERDGCLVETDTTVDETEIRRIIERLTAPTGRQADLRSPLVDLRLIDGSRAHVVLPPVAVDGPYLTIRRFGRTPVLLDAFGPPEMVALLNLAVRQRSNIVVSGGTGSGKTTLLNALCSALPDDERVVTIEDAAELRLPGNHIVRLECRPPDSEGLLAVGTGDLVRAALRMRPDRIIVGEVRGAEAIDMLWAMNTGHAGSMTTCHANSPADALSRLESMALGASSGLSPEGVRERIGSAVDLVVQVARHDGGARRIVSIAEPSGGSGTETDMHMVADDAGACQGRRRPPRWQP